MASVGVLGFALLLLHIWRYPAVGVSAVDPAQFSLPQASKLLAMLRSLSWLGLINLSALCLGALFERGLPLSAALSRFRLLYQLGIGFSLLGLGILGLAALHLLHVAGFATLLIAPPALWILFSWSRFRVGAVSRWWGRAGRPSSALLWTSAAYGLLLANAFIQAFGPDFGFDALMYHLAFPERYLFENGISMTPFSHLSGYIAGTEMLYALALFLDGPSLAVLIHFEFGVLTLAALWQLGAVSSRRAAVLAPLFLIADPLFQLELGWAYSDLSFSFYFTLAAIAFCTFIQKRHGPDANDGADPNEGTPLNAGPDGIGRDLVYAGIACGMCCATRYLGAGVAVALCAVAWLPPRHTRVRENLRACFALAGLSALVMLPWMVRNAVLTGNPITPLLQSLFYAPGNEYIPAIVMQQSAEFLRQVGMGRDLWSLLALPWNLTMASKPGIYANSFGYEVSALVLVALVAVMGLAASGKRLRAIPLLVPLLEIVAVFVLIWFFTFQEARFLLPVFPLIAYAGAVAIDGLIVASPGWGRGLLLLPLIAVVHSQLSMLPSLAANFEFALGETPHQQGDDRGVEAAAAFVRDEMAPGDKLLLWMEPRGYLFRGVDYVPYHIGSGAPTLALVHRFEDHQALGCGLRAMGITHLVINRLTEKLVQPGLLGPDYYIDDFFADGDRINRLIEASGRLLFSNGAFEVHQLEERTCSPGSAN
ncbi:MAG: hypothetical protein IH885_01040 [Myxococcales bacterium]|nr:hypothetical protein [Myxococcales bacterium]